MRRRRLLVVASLLPLVVVADRSTGRRHFGNRTAKGRGSCDDSVAKIWLHGQPKSGTTWLEVIVNALAEAGGGAKRENDKSQHPERHPWIWTLRGAEVRAKEKHELPGRPRPSGREKRDDKRFVYVNLEHSYDNACRGCVERAVPVWSPACSRDSYPGVCGRDSYVLVLRDPRAVAVSWAHFTNPRRRGDCDFCGDRDVSAWAPFAGLDAAVARDAPKIAALTSLRYYWHAELVDASNPSLLLFYEDLLGPGARGEYERLARFIGADVADVGAVVNNTTASAMRTQQRKGQLSKKQAGAGKIRSATADAFRAELGAAALANVTRAIAPLLHPVLRARWISGVEDARDAQPALASLYAAVHGRCRNNGDESTVVVAADVANCAEFQLWFGGT